MDKILGAKLLIAPDRECDTLEALQGYELIILHFSATKPESFFTSLLSNFYKVCQQNNVQMIDVSRNLGSMSCCSVLSSEDEMRIVQKLQNELVEDIRGSSLPTLVIFNARGEMIVQNATSQIKDVANDEDASKTLIMTWKHLEQGQTMNRGNDGLTSSFLSKLKKLVVGEDVDENDEFHTDNKCSPSIEAFQNSHEGICNIIETFFDEVTFALQTYPTIECVNDFLRPIENNTDESYRVPISLSEQRRLLLQVQTNILENVISRQDDGVGDSSGMSLTLQDVQHHLRSIGENDCSHLTSNSEEQEKLIKKMNIMNETARMAFVRSVLYAEMNWLTTEEHYAEHDNNGLSMKDWPIDYRNSRRKYRRSIKDGRMDRDLLLEYCGLCITAVNLGTVQSYIETGQDMFASHFKLPCSKPSVNSKSSTQHRILLLQQLMLCAIGFEPNYGGEELRQILQQGFDGAEANDHELGEQISTYLLSMQTVAQKAMKSSELIGLSDEQSGGVTRVVSVNYSEKTLTDGVIDHARGGNVAPSNVKMEEHEDDETQQLQDLKIAAKAASLQHNILQELESMDVKTRTEVLAKAKELHEKVMGIVLSLDSGLERVQYLQTEISPEDQHLLLIHKLWENR